MPAVGKLGTVRNRCAYVARLCTVLLFCVACVSRADAGATLLLEEPYAYDGAFAGTGHSAVYLSNVCAESPVVLRKCKAGESGVVLSRYDGINGYDWIAVPLIPYLYAVERADAVPLFADAKLVAFLRDQYRRDHFESLAPDRADGTSPAGNWYELVGSAYDRTIYGFEIETSPAQDAALIDRFNSQPNIQRYNFVKQNCADFVREVIDFYYPHALHRSIIGDLGVTTPKQIAKMMAKYSHHHPELESSNFLVPQVPGAVRRSKPVHGVLESVMAAKKYMVPLVILHPYIGGGLLVEYFGHRRFDPSRNDLVLEADGELDKPITREQRVALQSLMDELSAGPLVDAKGKTNETKAWERLQAGAKFGFDTSGEPILRMGVGNDVDDRQLGLARTNLLGGSTSPELAVQLLQARLREELRPAIARKTSHREVEKDLKLFQQSLSLQAGPLTATPLIAKPSSASIGPAPTSLQ